MTSNSDPNGLLNSVVKISGTAREDLNGRVGTAVSYQADRGRYMISLWNNDDNAAAQQPPLVVLSLKPDNLAAASMLEKARHRFTEARYAMLQARNDPQLAQAYEAVRRALPPPLKPEYVLGGLVVLWSCAVYRFGWSKTFLGSSLLVMPLLVSAPDIVPQLMQQGRLDVRSIGRNFPQRWHTMLVQSTGVSRITPRVAMGVFVLLMLFSGTVLLTPAPVQRPNPSSSSSSSSGAATTTAATSNTLKQATVSGDYNIKDINMNDLYKLGYNDAKAGLAYGHSRPESTASSSNTPYVDHANAARDDELNFDYAPPPPNTTPRSKFDMTTMMALFTLFRTGKQLGTGPDGSLNLELLVANARMMDPMRMGLTGLALYRLLSVFLF